MSTVAETFDTKRLGHRLPGRCRVAAGSLAGRSRVARGSLAGGGLLFGAVAWQAGGQQAHPKTSKNPIRKLSLGKNRRKEKHRERQKEHQKALNPFDPATGWQQVGNK